MGGLPWLEDLRDKIPQRAYYGYHGWHLAKALFSHSPFKAVKLYLRALVCGAFNPKLAVVVLCQIVFPAPLYRALANAVIKTQGSVLAQNQIK